MNTCDVVSLKQQYENVFGNEGVSASILNEIENELGVSLPTDLKEISTFYGGGILGGISHHAFGTGPADNVRRETLRIRNAIGLPHRYVVLAEPTDSLVILDTEAKNGPVVIWCDAHELEKLPNVNILTSPETWSSYAEFFGYLLQQEKDGGL